MNSNSPVQSFINDLESYLYRQQPKSWGEAYQQVVDAPFHNKIEVVKFDLGITVLLLVNLKEKTVDRIALSKTSMARGAVRMSAKPFEAIKIPISNKQNIINKAIKNNTIKRTSDWHDLFVPDLTPHQARFNQLGAGIECSVVSPLNIKDGGAMIFSFYQPEENLNSTHLDFISRYCKLAQRFLTNHTQLAK